MTLAWLGLLLATTQYPTYIVVSPDDAAAGPDTAWVAEYVADELPRALARLDLPVISRAERLRAVDAIGLPAAPLTRASSIRVAESVGVERLIVGTYQLRDGNLMLSLRMLDLKRGVLTAPMLSQGPLTRIAAMLDDLAWDAALMGPQPLSMTKEQFVGSRAPVGFEALRAYAQGLSARDAASRARALREAIKLQGDFDPAWLSLGQLYLERREYEQAARHLLRVSPASPDVRAARFAAAYAYIQASRPAEADTLLKTLGEQSETAACLNNRALALWRLSGRAESGRVTTWLRRAVELDDQRVEPAFNLGWIQLASGEAEAAVFWLRGVAQRQTDDPNARLVFSWALRACGRKDEADKQWRLAVAAHPAYEQSAEPDLGKRFERLCLLERNVAVELETRSDDELSAAAIAQAERALAGGDAEQALHELNRAVYLNPHSARAHLLLARAAKARGQADLVVAELRMSLWCREDAAVRSELIEYLRAVGREAEAKRAETEGAAGSVNPDPASARKKE